MPKVVFIRLDKIGDLVATLPVDQMKSLQGWEVKWGIAEGLAWIAKQAVPSRSAIELSLQKDKWKTSYRLLHEFLKTEKPDAVVIFYAPWWASLACWQAGVPIRGGRISQWHSFLFLNRGLRQSRSEALQHEADYNRELVEHTLQLPAGKTPILHLQVNDNPHLLEKLHLQKKNFYVVHPGMFGSALNWPQKKYNELISELIKKSPVVITGTQNDERFLSNIKLAWQNHSQVRIAQNQLSMPELLSLLSMAKAVIAPSTGVLHLAVSLGVPSVGIYSPIQVHHPRRWGPRGKSAEYVLPDVICPALDKCEDLQCQHFPCMETITVNQVLSQLEKLMAST